MGKTIDLRKNCTTSDPSGENLGIKYHLKTGDSRTIANCFQYALDFNFIIDATVELIIEEGGQVSVREGFIENNGTITSNGQIFNT